MATRTVGACIRDARKARGLTLEELAQVSGRSRSSLARLETDGRRTTVDELKLLAQLLGVDADVFYDAVEPAAEPKAS